MQKPKSLHILNSEQVIVRLKQGVVFFDIIIDVLGEYFKTSSLKLVRLKSQAILMKNEGLKLNVISRLLFRDKRTVQRWLKEFLEIRLASIFTGHKDNENASKLTKEQKKEIKETLSKPPSEYGLPKEFWDVPAIKRYVKAEFGVIYESRQSYHFLLKFSDLSFKLPDLFDYLKCLIRQKKFSEILLQAESSIIKCDISF